MEVDTAVDTEWSSPNRRPTPGPAPAGATFGVEEEFHLVDPVSATG